LNYEICREIEKKCFENSIPLIIPSGAEMFVSQSFEYFFSTAKKQANMNGLIDVN